MTVVKALSELVESVVAFVVMILLGVVSFFITVIVVQTGSALAGYTPPSPPVVHGNFVVLSSALIVTASIIAGAMR